MLFANGDALFGLLVVGLVIYGIGYGCYSLYMMTKHPQEWAAMQQRTHEQKMHDERLKAMREMQKQEEAAARHRRNSAWAGVGNVLLRAFLRH